MPHVQTAVCLFVGESVNALVNVGAVSEQDLPQWLPTMFANNTAV